MGLDQFAYTRDAEGEQIEELKYWRKHNALQGWMEKLWAIKTSKSESDLNCQDLEITTEDLDQLWTCIKHQTLPQTQGFFFGSDTSHDATRQDQDLEFVAKAREAISEGDQVFYTCWW